MDEARAVTGPLEHYETIQEKKLPEFTLFSKLPTKLRLGIWSFAIPGPTLVAISLSLNDKYCIGRRRPPTLVQVCHESRAVASTCIQLSFGHLVEACLIYFNSGKDTRTTFSQRRMLLARRGSQARGCMREQRFHSLQTVTLRPSPIKEVPPTLKPQIPPNYRPQLW